MGNHPFILSHTPDVYQGPLSICLVPIFDLLAWNSLSPCSPPGIRCWRPQQLQLKGRGTLSQGEYLLWKTTGFPSLLKQRSFGIWAAPFSLCLFWTQSKTVKNLFFPSAFFFLSSYFSLTCTFTKKKQWKSSETLTHLKSDLTLCITGNRSQKYEEWSKRFPEIRFLVIQSSLTPVN